MSWNAEIPWDHDEFEPPDEFDAPPPPDGYAGGAMDWNPASPGAADAGRVVARPAAAPPRRATAKFATAAEALRTVFGYDSFRGEQAAIIDQVIGGNDAVVLMPTGGGKSLCYQIPSLVREGTGIVISPLIALMQDQVDALTAVGVRAAFLNSSQDSAARGQVERDYLAGHLDLLYVAPERLSNEATKRSPCRRGTSRYPPRPPAAGPPRENGSRGSRSTGHP